MQIVESTPWVIGQELTGTDGVTYVASGESSYKCPAPVEAEPDPVEPDRQEVFCPGDTLPTWMQGKVNVCLTDSSVVQLTDGELIADDVDGCIIVDGVTGVPTFNQTARKPQGKNYVRQDAEPTKEQVDAGVCIWRNTTDGCLYTVTINADGTCTWFSSDKGDTDTFATVIEAPSAGIDDYNNSYPAGADLILFSDGTEMCVQKTNELGPRIVVDVDDAATLPSSSSPYEKQCLYDADGNLVGVVDSTGSHLIQDNDDELGPSIEVNPDDATTLPADSGDWKKQCLVDSDGNMVGFVDSDGAHLITSTDKFGTVVPSEDNKTATVTLFDAAGNEVVCDFSLEKTELLCATPESDLMTFRTTNLKTGVVDDVVFTADKECIAAPIVTSFNFIDPLISTAVGIANFTPVTELVEFELSCNRNVDIEFEMHLNADANPGGIPGEGLNFGVLIDGAASPTSMLVSYSPADLGVLGTSESTIANQEDAISAKLCKSLTSGAHSLQLVTWISNAPDEGEGIQYQGVKFTASYNTLKCC